MQWMHFKEDMSKDACIREKENLKQDALIINNTLVLLIIGFNKEALRMKSSGRMPLWMI